MSKSGARDSCGAAGQNQGNSRFMVDEYVNAARAHVLISNIRRETGHEPGTNGERAIRLGKTARAPVLPARMVSETLRRSREIAPGTVRSRNMRHERGTNRENCDSR